MQPVSTVRNTRESIYGFNVDLRLIALACSGDPVVMQLLEPIVETVDCGRVLNRSLLLKCHALSTSHR